VTTQWKHKKGGEQLKHKGGVLLKQKKLQQLHYLNTAQANAQVNNIFDSISSSDHGANNGMLQKRAQHRPKTPQFGFGNEGARAAPQDPKSTPVQGIFSSEGNGDVSIKAPRAQQLAAAAAARTQALEVTEENPLGLTLDAIPEDVNSLNGINEEDTSPEEVALRGWDWFHAQPVPVGAGMPAVP